MAGAPPGSQLGFSRSAARDQLVLASWVDLEEEELAIDQIPVGVEADRLPEDGGRLARRLDRREHVAAAGRLTGLAHRCDRLVDHVRPREHEPAERAAGPVLPLLGLAA